VIEEPRLERITHHQYWDGSTEALYALCPAQSSGRVVHHTRDDGEADREHFDGKTTEQGVDREHSLSRRFSYRGGNEMNAVKMAAIVLIAAGVLGLVYGSFSYTKDTHDVKLGPIELSVKDKETVNIPVWAGVGAIVVGGGLLLVGGKKS